MKKTIGLLKIGEFDKSILIKLKKNVEREFEEFNISVSIIQEKIPLDEVKYNPIRRQYDASKVLNSIIFYNKDKQYFRILGIMDSDIFTSGLNFVFGIAMSPKFEISRGPVMALISITRLREKFYRRPESMALFELRILKEAIHELGHTFSLEHCNKFCIMRFSNSLADTDEKPPKFCDSCMKKLKNFLKT
ncbi:MAG: archaemetzincin family Zn-dependent metalloprotease [Promethearchaeota archaeon]|nr:MAG: archaemetzincin family Zn-dependent metalloprotease [Candidatus Lokiarchaeota archaeon]